MMVPGIRHGRRQVRRSGRRAGRGGRRRRRTAAAAAAAARWEIGRRLTREAVTSMARSLVRRPHAGLVESARLARTAPPDESRQTELLGGESATTRCPADRCGRLARPTALLMMMIVMSARPSNHVRSPLALRAPRHSLATLRGTGQSQSGRLCRSKCRVGVSRGQRGSLGERRTAPGRSVSMSRAPDQPVPVVHERGMRSSRRCRVPPNTSVPSAMPPTRNTHTHTRCVRHTHTRAGSGPAGTHRVTPGEQLIEGTGRRARSGCTFPRPSLSHLLLIK